jgi:hypothetical protein
VERASIITSICDSAARPFSSLIYIVDIWDGEDEPVIYHGTRHHILEARVGHALVTSTQDVY